jgi:hypothetical protein
VTDHDRRAPLFVESNNRTIRNLVTAQEVRDPRKHVKLVYTSSTTQWDTFGLAMLWVIMSF